MAEQDPIPELLVKMDALGYRVFPWPHSRIEGVELFLVDLSSLKLNLSDRTPFFFVRTKLMEMLPGYDLLESLIDIARGEYWIYRDCIVLLEKEDSSLKHLALGKINPSFVVLDSACQKAILLVGSPIPPLLDQICTQLPLSSLAPYSIGGVVTGSKFFGREGEIKQIMRNPNINFAVVGIRRIGKSCLLKEIELRLLKQINNKITINEIELEIDKPVVWLDGSTMSNAREFLAEVVGQLSSREMVNLYSQPKYFYSAFKFLKRMSKKFGRKITIFLDEADNFLEWGKKDPELFPAIRASSIGGYCQFIFAGFKQLIEELSNNNSPFYNIFEPILLGPFQRDETEQVVLVPLHNLRLKIENETTIVNQIHTDTGGIPLLVQTYCREIVNLLEEMKSRNLSPGFIKEIYSGEIFRIQLVNSFRNNVEKVDKLLVLSLLKYYPVEKTIFSKQEISKALSEINCPFSNDDIDRACERLVISSVFLRKEKLYSYVIPMFSKVISLNLNIVYELSVTKEELGL